LPEICGDAAFYFQTGDLDSFVSSLQIACFDESQRATKKENGKRLVTSYSWQKCAASTLAIYKQ
jgi:glycosyltransferase involved in cell wall biosynthesis